MSGPWTYALDTEGPCNGDVLVKTSKGRLVAVVYATGDDAETLARAGKLCAADELVGAISKLGRVLLPIDLGLAQAELVGEPVPDSAVVLHFMGSGASDQVTAGEYRAAIAAATTAVARTRAVGITAEQATS